MSDRESTARAREIGAELRRLREGAGRTAREFAEVVGWSSSKVSRVEAGLRGVTEIDVVRFAAYCRALPTETDDLVARCREADISGYWVARRTSTLVFHENTAVRSFSYDPLMVPGLLQTESYVRALARRERLDPWEVQRLVEARMDRQDVLRRREFRFFVHEQALRFPVGDDWLMNEQMLKLMLLAEHPSISIRVVPFAAGLKGALGSEFVLFHFEDGPSLVHLGHGRLSLFLENRSYVERYQEHVASMADVALDREQSREMLVALASEFDSRAARMTGKQLQPGQLR